MRIIITQGDPNGIGIEVMLKALQVLLERSTFDSDIRFAIAGNSNLICSYTQAMGFPVETAEGTLSIAGCSLEILECKSQYTTEFGKVNRLAGKAASDALEAAVGAVLDGRYNALVTMPVSKEALHLAGWRFPGQTEMLAARTKVKNPLMMLCSGSIRVALATIHIAIKELPFELTTASIINLATIFNKSLIEDFSIDKPRIAVLGLNPHAGESGAMGAEESTIIQPALDHLKKRGIEACGPFPADGFFGFGDYLGYDGILAMYHDQGLVPLKLLSQGAGVNFTAGLPIVRTSPDHGTAFDIAGKGIADCKSSVEAIDLAIAIASRRKALSRKK